MSLSRLLAKADLWTDESALDESYTNPGIPETTVTSIGSALDYIISVLFPNAQPSVATENDLPTGTDTPNLGDITPDVNDYRIVLNYNGTGQAAGFRYNQLEGQASPQWNLVQLFDSQDSILQAWEQDAAGLFALLLGNESVDGQTIHGSTEANGNLTLSANSGDGTNDPALQTGYVQFFSQIRPTNDNVFNLGTAAERFASLYLGGSLSDGTVAITVAQALAAYNHSLVTSGNPHSVAYAELLSRLGNVTVDGDVSTVVIDFSTGGDKTITLSITNDSHNHTVSTITDFDDATWALLKARLVDTSEVSWTFNDTLKTASADITIDTASISDIASPAVNKTLVSNPAGDEWVAGSGTVELTGDVTGSGTYDSATDKVSFATSVINAPIGNIDRIQLDNLSISIAADAQSTVTQVDHGLISGRKIRIFGTTTFDGEHVVSVVDANTYQLGIDNSLGSIETGYQIPDGSQFMYDSTLDKWNVQLEFSQISHNEVSNLLADDHTQYHNINGRGDGSLNPVTGGADANGNLYLRSTSNATKGSIRFEDNIIPQTDASYSGGWTGTNIGSPTNRVNNLYMAGVVVGGRIETVTSLPTASIENKGLIVLVNGNDAYINKDGVTWRKIIDSTNPLVGALNYQGTWDANTNTPDLTAINTKGSYYVVSVDGNTNLDGITDWKATDVAVHNGTTWEKIDNTDAVSSVNGQTGTVVLTTTNVAEGTNLYYTDARARAAIQYTQEVPSGLVDGVNTSYALTNAPIQNAALLLYLNGIIQRQGIDYTISGLTITMTTAPVVGQDLYAAYHR